MDLPPDELIGLFLAEVERIYGSGYADQTICAYSPRGGWFYVSFPRHNGEERIVDLLVQPIRRAVLVAMLNAYRSMP